MAFQELETKEYRELSKKYHEVFGRYPAYNYDDYPDVDEYIENVKKSIEAGKELKSEHQNERNQSYKKFFEK